LICSFQGSSNRESIKSSESRSTSTPSPPPLPAANGFTTIEVAKEAKEKKDRPASWMKTIGFRTLRLRNKNSETSKSRASIAGELMVASLDRTKVKKGKNNETGQEKLNTDEHVDKKEPGENAAKNAEKKNGVVTGENGTGR